MARYKKKPIEVEAFRWLIDQVPQWWIELEGVTIDVATGSINIPTKEGSMKANKGDYII